MKINNKMSSFNDKGELRVVKAIRDRPFFFPVKCEMAIFFLVNRDFHNAFVFREL